MRVLVCGPAHPGLTAALDRVHAGPSGPVTRIGIARPHNAQAAKWAAGNGLKCLPADADVAIHNRWPALVVVTPGDSSGSAARADRAGIAVIQIAQLPPHEQSRALAGWGCG